jgi:hypothetical protein
VHGRAVEAGTGKAVLGGIEDVLSPRRLHLRLELWHVRSHLLLAGTTTFGAPPRAAQNKTNNRFICAEAGKVKALAWNCGVGGDHKRVSAAGVPHACPQ